MPFDTAAAAACPVVGEGGTVREAGEERSCLDSFLNRLLKISISFPSAVCPVICPSFCARDLLVQPLSAGDSTDEEQKCHVIRGMLPNPVK